MNEPCYVFEFGLIVTGKGEEEALPKLFSSLRKLGICSFKVISRSGQLSPITSPKKKLELNRKTIPSRDEQYIGIPARTFLRRKPCTLVILIDDLEEDRRSQISEVFTRYRAALDTFLNSDEQLRASVHFLVNMLEAYYFADTNAVNGVLGECLDADWDGDVEEEIAHPKGELKRRCQGFDERKHADDILGKINVEHILSNPKTCASLRTLFAWCVNRLEQHPQFSELPIPNYQLTEGILSEITKGQI
jgi:hypothetical protein